MPLYKIRKLHFVSVVTSLLILILGCCFVASSAMPCLGLIFVVDLAALVLLV